MSILYNDGTTVHSTNLERARTDVRTAGNLSALNAELVLALNGEATFSVDVRNTFVGTLTVEGTYNGTDYFSLPVMSLVTEGWLTAIAQTQLGAYVGSCGSLRAVRLRMSAFTSGTANVTLNASLGDEIVIAKPIPATLAVTATGVAAAAVTLTLPAPAAGLYHYITRILISRFAAALLTAAATPVLVTTTNLPGTRVFSLPAEAAAQGTIYNEIVEPAQPLKSTAAATATTIVAPVTTGVIWRITADYYVSA